MTAKTWVLYVNLKLDCDWQTAGQREQCNVPPDSTTVSEVFFLDRLNISQVSGNFCPQHFLSYVT